MEAILLGAGAWLIGWKMVQMPTVKERWSRKQARKKVDVDEYIRDDNGFSARRYVDMTDAEVNMLGIEMGPPDLKTGPDRNQERSEFDPNTYQDVWRDGGHETPEYYEILA